MTTTSDTITPASATTNPIDVPESTESISPELQAKVHTIRAYAECHNILAVGQYDCRHFQTVANALHFLKTLHETSVQEAIKDKGAWRVPELKEYIEKAKEEAIKAGTQNVPTQG